MNRSSPAVQRVAAILDFIAGHPGQAFTMTDLVRALKLSRATCHALLTGLVEVGYLYRTSDKTYVLGPALVAIGRTAAKHFSPLQVAQPEMRKIADEYDIVCGAHFLEGDMTQLRDRAASVSHVSYPVPLGNKMKLSVAQAPAFFSWSPKDAQSWLERANPKPDASQIEHMFHTMELARKIGFVPVVWIPGIRYTRRKLDPQAMAELDDIPDDIPVVTLAEVDETAAYPIAAIMAPVFDARDRVSFCLVMAGFHSAMTGEQILAAGSHLRDACDRVSAFVAGRAS